MSRKVFCSASALPSAKALMRSSSYCQATAFMKSCISALWVMGTRSTFMLPCRPCHHGWSRRVRHNPAQMREDNLARLLQVISTGSNAHMSRMEQLLLVFPGQPHFLATSGGRCLFVVHARDKCHMRHSISAQIGRAH